MRVQQGPQPVQLHRVAQFFGADGLVIGGGEDAIGVDGAPVVHAVLTVGQGALVHFGAVIRGLAVGVGGGAVGAGLALVLGGLVVGRAFQRLAALAAVLFFLLVLVGRVLLRLVGLVFALLVVGVLSLTVAGIEVQRPQHVLQFRGKGRLVVGHGGQGVQFGPRLQLQIGAHQVQHGLGPVRRGLARQPFAHQQRRGLGHRHPLGLGSEGARLLQPGQKRRVQIVAHALQFARPDRLDPGLFNGVKDLGRRLIHGAQPGVQALVVIGQAQGQPVRLTAQGRALGRARIARRMGQGQDPVRQPRPVRAEMDLQLGLLGQSARGIG
ncbi:hypothetical protein D3C72_872330 [compost metagenome]